LYTTLTRAQLVASVDDEAAKHRTGRPFAQGARPVLRWTKGDGHDDDVTRAAIGQATRLFGDRVDYCLCTNGIDASRVRRILEWAEQPVEWWAVSEAENPTLAAALGAAGCCPERFGYWWKWFPERVRPDAPEWILDGDMVVVAPPEWWADWVQGTDPCRVSQDDTWPADALYGRYRDLVDLSLRLYSGLVSLPPRLSYMPSILDVLARRPLEQGHDGTRDMCEQGVIAAAFQALRARPVQLCDFPFARAFQPALDFGKRGNRGRVWGYHFGHAFRGPNQHFARLAHHSVVLHLTERPSIPDRFRWLGGSGQWGVPGWGSSGEMKALVEHYARAFKGRRVLELGTSRGAMAALLATLGCKVTAVDRQDRGARDNLAGLNCTVVQAEAAAFLRGVTDPFALIVADLHGNSMADWSVLWPLLQRVTEPGGMILLCNATLSQIPEWKAEDGIPWLLGTLGADWQSRLHAKPLPGLAVVVAPGGTEVLPPPPAAPEGVVPSPRSFPQPQSLAAALRSIKLSPVLPQPYRPTKKGRGDRLRRWWEFSAGQVRSALRGLQVLATDPIRNARDPATRLLRVERSPQSSSSRSLVIYTHYSQHGRVSPMVLLQLREYVRLGFRAVFVTNSRTLAEDDLRAVREIVEVAVQRQNFGRDFGAWADVVRCVLPDPGPWDELLLANDSVIGPLAPLDPIIARMREAGEGVFGLTEGVQLGSHLQSYFVLARGTQACTVIMDFLRGIRLSDSKYITIQRGEIGLTHTVRQSRVPVLALHGYSDLERAAATSPAMREALAAMLPDICREVGATDQQLVLRRALLNVPLNPTHHFAVLLVRMLGFPFLKTEFLLSNPVRHPEALDWEDLIPPGAPCDAAMALQHLSLQILGVASPPETLARKHDHSR
jgi:hypothetical protein